MQISKQRAQSVLMLRPILALPLPPHFPPSYPLPNRICRIAHSPFLRRQECQSRSPGACWDMNSTFPESSRGEKTQQSCSPFLHLYDESLRVRLSMSCRRGCRMCSRQTLDSLLELVCLGKNYPAPLPDRCPYELMIFMFERHFVYFDYLTYYTESYILVWLQRKKFHKNLKWQWQNCVGLTKSWLHCIM